MITLTMLLSAEGLSLAANIDSQIRTQQKSQADMKRKIQQYNALAKEKSKQSKTLLSQLSRLKQDANSSQEQITSLDRETTRLRRNVVELNRDIDNLQASIAIILDTLKGRLTDIYKYTPSEQSISLILSSGGPHDAVNTAYMLQRFAHQDLAMLRELARKEHELLEARKQLETTQKAIEQQSDELKRKRAEYDTAVRKTDTLLRSVQSEQKKAEAAARDLQSAQRARSPKPLARQ